MNLKYFLLSLFLVFGFFFTTSQVKAAEMVGHWALDESTQGATVVDTGTGSNNGTPSGTGGGPSPTSTAPSVTFSNPRSYYFNGIDQHVQIASSFTSAVSVTFWFKPLANGSGGGNDQWYNGSGLFDAEISGVTNDFGVTWSADHVEFGIGNPDITIRSGALALGSWYSVSATWQKSDGAMKLYINGSLVDSATGSLNNRISTNVRFGNELSGANAHYKGYMDDIRTFDVALDASQVQSISNGNSITLTAADNPTVQSGSSVPFPPPITPEEGKFIFKINNGATSTDSSLVTFTSNAKQDVTLIKISENEVMIYPWIIPYYNGMTWNFCWMKTICSLGKHTIYSQLLNAYGLNSPILSASIDLVPKQATSTDSLATSTTPTQQASSTPSQLAVPTFFKGLTWEEIYQPQNKLQSKYMFNKNLKFGDINEDVRQLQIFLNAQGFALANNGPGSAGNETFKFLKYTYLQLSRFQKQYQSSIGYAPNGVFDFSTRRVVNELNNK